jgi:hypothetical protein
MSDTAQFMAEVDAMFAATDAHVDRIVTRWFMLMHRALIVQTPGPGNQWPGVRYFAVGRLRMGYQYSVAPPPAEVPANRKRPETARGADGAAARRKLDATIEAIGVRHEAIYLWNEVGYGYYPHEGLGRGHDAKIWPGRGPRPFIRLFAASETPAEALAVAVAETD